MSATNPIITVAPEGWVQSKDIWLPKICPRQLDVFNDFHRYLLVTGPRKAAKTLGILHKVLRHCFDLNGARVAIFSKTIKNAKSGGVYVDLTEIVLPEWLEADMGMKLTQKPKVTGDTRQSLFKVSNRYGTESEVQLHSLEYAPEVVDKIKGTRWSLIYFIEIDNWNDRIIFDIATDQLRMYPNIPYDQHQFIGDCNPPETGPNNWLHDLWFKEKDKPDHPNPVFQNNIHRIEFKLEDNPFLPKAEVEELKNKYSYRQSIYNRFVLGKWEEDTTEGHFSDVFKPAIHVLGDTAKAEPEVIVPSAACRRLLTGWDPGDKNHAAVIAEKLEMKPQDDGPPLTKFAIIDELCVFDGSVSIRDFAEAFLEKIEKWERYCLAEYGTKIKWRNWSDSSVFRFRAAAESTDELIIREASKGRILLDAAPKYRNSVRDRVKLVSQLLFENRLFFSANCVDTIASIRMLRKGNSEAEFIARSKHKHPFDAMSYILSSEVPVDMAIYNEFKLDKPKKRICFA